MSTIQPDCAIYKQSLCDLSREQLINIAIQNQEAELAANQALNVNTGKRTGRSPKDRFIVKDDTTKNTVAWGHINQPIDPQYFQQLWDKVTQYLQTKPHYLAHLSVGADPQHSHPVTVITEFAWQQLFVRNLFIENNVKSNHSTWTLMCVPSYHADPSVDACHSEAAIIINFSQQRVLICGTHYAGEMKKAMFSVLNFLLPEKNILPMHCAANVGRNGDVALFFGLSGTGKTTLSADPKRLLIGDDEHGWSEQGVFNFEGGCYAKCIDLSPEREPVIWEAIRSGAIMENVVLDPITKEPDYSDCRFTQNTRAAYPRSHIALRVEENYAGQPKAVVFLTCDLYGVLPPVSLLTKQQAAYHFLSGYTALVGSTEVGQTAAIKTTFSTCFGAPFFPRPAAVYANLLMQRIAASNAQVYLVNTGWTGGAYGAGGKRFSIPTTRAIIDAILSGELQQASLTTLSGFNLRIPQQITEVDKQLLNPRDTWQDKTAFDQQLKQLIALFQQNFQQFEVDKEILKEGGPSS